MLEASQVHDMIQGVGSVVVRNFVASLVFEAAHSPGETAAGDRAGKCSIFQEIHMSIV